MMGKALAVAAGLALVAPLSIAGSDDLTVYRGSAEVAGPAMLTLDGKRILLYGVDAPVRGQPCYAGNKTWDCATASAKTLLNLVGDQEITCEQRRIDQFGRVFALCKAGAVDINRSLVEAMAVSTRRRDCLFFVRTSGRVATCATNLIWTASQSAVPLG